MLNPAPLGAGDLVSQPAVTGNSSRTKCPRHSPGAVCYGAQSGLDAFLSIATAPQHLKSRGGDCFALPHGTSLIFTSPSVPPGAALPWLSLAPPLGWKPPRSKDVLSPSPSSRRHRSQALPEALPARGGCGEADKISVIRHRPSSKLG